MKLKAEDKFAGLNQRAKALQAKFGPQPDPYLVSSRVAEALCPPAEQPFDLDEMVYRALTRMVTFADGTPAFPARKPHESSTLTLDKVKQAAAKLDAERAAFVAELQAFDARQSVPDRVADALCPPKANKDDMLDAIKYSFLQPWQIHQVNDRGAIALNSCA